MPSQINSHPTFLGALYEMEGESARLAGKDISCNPYASDRDAYWHWQAGWLTAPDKTQKAG